MRSESDELGSVLQAIAATLAAGTAGAATSGQPEPPPPPVANLPPTGPITGDTWRPAGDWQGQWVYHEESLPQRPRRGRSNPAAAAAPAATETQTEAAAQAAAPAATPAAPVAAPVTSSPAATPAAPVAASPAATRRHQWRQQPPRRHQRRGQHAPSASCLLETLKGGTGHLVFTGHSTAGASSAQWRRDSNAPYAVTWSDLSIFFVAHKNKTMM